MYKQIICIKMNNILYILHILYMSSTKSIYKVTYKHT